MGKPEIAEQMAEVELDSRSQSLAEVCRAKPQIAECFCTPDGQFHRQLCTQTSLTCRKVSQPVTLTDVASSPGQAADTLYHARLLTLVTVHISMINNIKK